MAKEFTIRFTLRTAQGFEPLCDFYIGNDLITAVSIFSQLEGNDKVCDADILQVDFVETQDGLPVNVKIKHCTLLEMGRSCQFITKEIFKYRNLFQGG